MAWLLFMLDRSLASEAGFESVRHYVGLVPVKLALLALIWAYCHHFCAGIRFLLIDLDKGVDRATARLTSGLVLGVSLALTAWLGAKLWWIASSSAPTTACATGSRSASRPSSWRCTRSSCWCR